jgi:hypothetical protein
MGGDAVNALTFGPAMAWFIDRGFVVEHDKHGTEVRSACGDESFRPYRAEPLEQAARRYLKICYDCELEKIDEATTQAEHYRELIERWPV